MDCTFKTEQGRFNYRVGAIIIHENKVLMVKNSRDPYYYSVGGRVHMHESMEQAIKREVYEETGIMFEIDRMGYIHENFFVLDHTGEKFHELWVYYYMKPLENYILKCESLTEGGIKEYLEWIPLNDIKNYEVYPQFFKDETLTSRNDIVHIVNREY
ncbi:MAG: NUDIX domain-containing protein [Firmicutes bacterium]|nr:NUDIX domain-containing protein [Bacillota bacterium]